MAVVYGLRAKDSDQYFYVGCTKHTAERRLAGHLEAIRNKTMRNRHFVHKAKKIGLENIVADVLEETTEADRFSREEWWIKHLLASGAKLVNRIHNDVDPEQFDTPDDWPSWDYLKWALEWHKEYKAGRRLEAVNPDNTEIVELCQRKLAEFMTQNEEAIRRFVG